MSVRSLLVAAALGAGFPAVAAETATASQNARNSANLNVLQSLYPKRALAAREQGQVGFIVKLDASGQPTECRVTMSSGYPLLDKETCDLITLNAVFKRPAGISGSQLVTHQGTVTWTLPDSVSVLPNGAERPATLARGLPEKKVCKKSTKTGSLVATERVCMTPSQWRKQSDESREMWYELQGHKGSTKG